MKTLKKTAMLALLLGASAISFNCSSDSSSGGSTSTFYLKCKVNGTLLEFTDPFVINSLSKSISGANPDTGESLVLFVPLDATVGSHAMTDEPSNVNAYDGDYYTEDTAIDNETGTMVITTVTADVIAGTFAFSGEDGDGNPIVITEGQFRAENVD